MKVPVCRLYSVGEITSWAKQFLNALQKESIADVIFENQVQRFCETPIASVAIVFIENAPDMKKEILKLRTANKPMVVVWFGKLFSKEDTMFAHENRVYWLLENPRADDKKTLDSIRRIAAHADVVQQYGQHLHSLKALLLQGESEEAMRPLLHEFRTALSKLERCGWLANEFAGAHAAEQGQTGEQERLPFVKSQGIGDALLTVHELERTGALWIRGSLPEQEGKLEFLQGKVVAASAGAVRGLKAIFRMFLWDEPRFLFTRIDPSEYVFEDHLNVSLKYVGAEGEDLNQRYQKIRRDLPPPELEIELEPSALHAGTQLSPEDFSTLASIVEFGVIAQVVDFNTQADVTIYESLIRLRKHNMIRVSIR